VNEYGRVVIVKRKILLCILGLLMVTLLLAQLFRYKTLSVGEGTKTYVDLWTGNKWSEVKHEQGTDRIAIDLDTKQLSEQEVIHALTEMKNKETIVSTVWYSFFGALLIAAVGTAVKMNRNPNSHRQRAPGRPAGAPGSNQIT
jgi:hypothetical protein